MESQMHYDIPDPETYSDKDAFIAVGNDGSRTLFAKVGPNSKLPAGNALCVIEDEDEQCHVKEVPLTKHASLCDHALVFLHPRDFDWLKCELERTSIPVNATMH